MSLSRGLCSLALLLAACGPARDGPRGTSVGNPGKTGVALARGAGLEFQEAHLEDALIEVIGCDVARATLLTGELGLLEDEPLVLPGGSWCAVVVRFGTLAVSGEVEVDEGDPQAFEVRLEPETTTTLWMGEPIVVDETSYVLEIGEPGWLSREQLGEGELVLVTPESDLAPTLTYSILSGTRLYEDDGDGSIDEDERGAGPLADPAEVPPPEFAGGEDRSVALEGCSNCATGGAHPSVGWAAVLLWLTARRRTAGRRRSAGR
jgi:hypothetical protein